MSRKKIQDEIDAKYFSRGSTVSNDELYYYILNLYEVLSKTYEEASKNYLNSIQTQMRQKKVQLINLLQEFLQRIVFLESSVNLYSDDDWSIHHVFEFVKFSEENDVLFKTYDDELGAIYYKIFLAMLKGDEKVLLDRYDINHKTQVAMKEKSFKISPLENPQIVSIINFLTRQPRKVTNASLFIKKLNKQMSQLISESDNLFDIKDEDIKAFNDKLNIFICKQKCPCCGGICGVQDPTHNSHQCIYSHQIRGIGGVMLENKGASVSRCEDIDDIDKMQFNEYEMTWKKFKENMKSQANNPWIFDDIIKTRDDIAIKERFRFAWTLIGKRICEEKYKGTGMKYVEYNQAIIDSQKVVQAQPKNYIYMIDSSSLLGSMNGNKWTELLQALKKTLGQICTLNKISKVRHF